MGTAKNNVIAMEGKYPTGTTAAELMSTVFAPMRWTVPGILPEGVTILSGKAKMGKSWLALGWCIAVATGGAALGKRQVEQGEALYLALEDNPRRIQSRLRKVLAGDKAPEGFYIYTEWERFDNGGVEALHYWLQDHPNTRLVVIDTLKKVRPRGNGNRNIYDVDYEALEPLLPIAAEHNVSIMVVHHNNKMLDPTDPFDSISGSTGLTGGVDSVLILNRERGKADAFLYVDGRDIEDQGEHPLKWDHNVCSWTLSDGEPMEYRMSDERRVIFDVLPDHGENGIGPADVAKATGDKAANVRYLLGKMADADEAYRAGYGKYTKPPHTPHGPHTTNTAHGPHTGDGDWESVSGAYGGPHTSEPQTPPTGRSVSGVSGMRT